MICQNDNTLPGAVTGEKVVPSSRKRFELGHAFIDISAEEIRESGSPYPSAERNYIINRP